MSYITSVHQHINSSSHHFLALMRLMKFPLSLMVTFSALTGYYLTGKPLSPITLNLMFGVFFMASGSSALNQFQERSYDALMLRTNKRPIPSKQISAFGALMVSLGLIFAGTMLLTRCGLIPMILGLCNVVLYNLIYTPLKRFTWLAIVPGALVGAVPPLIGWTSGGPYIFHPIALFIAGFVFLWQLPHFWLLILRYKKDYETGGFSSLSRFMVETRIKNLIFFWTIVTSVYLFSFPLFGITFRPGVITVFAFLNILFIILFYTTLFVKGKFRSLRNAFILINSFALLVFIALIFGCH